MTVQLKRTLPFVVTAALLAALVAGSTRAQNQASNDPADCLDIVAGVGYPKPPGEAKPNTKFVCHTAFALSHNNTFRTPEWVVARLKGSELPDMFNRPDPISFRSEKAVPKAARAKDSDYAATKQHASPFERGHMEPSEDFNGDCELMKESFVFSNIVPQIGDKFNSGIWAQFEGEVREIAKERSEIVVITGPVPRKSGPVRVLPKAGNCGHEIKLNGTKQPFVCEAMNKGLKNKCDPGVGVAVPIAIYKIIYDPARKQAYAYIMPNRDHFPDVSDTEYLDTFRTTVRVIERETGLVFLPDLPVNVRNQVINSCAPGSPWAKSGSSKDQGKGKACK